MIDEKELAEMFDGFSDYLKNFVQEIPFEEYELSDGGNAGWVTCKYDSLIGEIKFSINIISDISCWHSWYFQQIKFDKEFMCKIIEFLKNNRRELLQEKIDKLLKEKEDFEKMIEGNEEN